MESQEPAADLELLDMRRIDQMEFSWLACGRIFMSKIKHPTPRKERYRRWHTNRHMRRCTACAKAVRDGRRHRREHPEQYFNPASLRDVTSATQASRLLFPERPSPSQATEN